MKTYKKLEEHNKSANRCGAMVCGILEGYGDHDKNTFCVPRQHLSQSDG